MAFPYHCAFDDRKALLRNTIGEDGLPLLNGIDFLEVAPDQQSLEVHFIHPLPGEPDGIPDGAGPLTAEQIRIDGGVRITPIRVLAAAAAGNILTVQVAPPGDFTDYRLRLVRSPLSPEAPEGFDPLLSEIPFSFKVGCPSPFDCGRTVPCPPLIPPSPRIDYLARDFQSFRRLILDRLSVTMPDFDERNPADMTVSLAELLAHAADQLAYYQDAVATEAYLGTARKRTSIRRHARLLDYVMHEGCNARTWVHLEVDAVADGSRLRRTDAATGNPPRFLSRFGENTTVDPEALDDVLAAHDPVVFEPLTETHLYAAHNEIRIYTWGRSECCLPAESTQCTLEDDPGRRLRLRVGDVLLLEERISPESGLEADADRSRRQVVRLTAVAPEAQPTAGGGREPGPLVTDPLTGQAVVEIAWKKEDALRFPACLSTTRGSHQLEDVTVARGNLVLADHGLSLESGLQPATPTANRLYRPLLADPHIGFNDTSADPAEVSATESLRQDPRRALPALVLEDNGHRWHPRAELLGSDGFDRHFVLERSEDGSATVRFGDGVHGRRPLPGSTFAARYRRGHGTEGNLGAEALAHVTTSLEGILTVRNPLPATGGTGPESLADVRQYAPEAFRRQERAVTEADYAEMAARHPEVAKAAATRRWTGSWYTVFVSPDRRGGLPIDEPFRDELRAFLEPFRLMSHDLAIDQPRFVALELVLTVCVKPNHFRSTVRAALLEAFGNGARPDGSRGFFHPDNFTFGQPVFISRILAAAMAVPGVLSVDADPAPPAANRFQRWGSTLDLEAYAAGVITMDRLEIARLDNDPNAPENGILDFVLMGGRQP